METLRHRAKGVAPPWKAAIMLRYGDPGSMTDTLARLLNSLPATPVLVKVFPERVVLRAMQLLAEDMARLSRS